MSRIFNDHQLAEARSLAYHQAIAERLRQQPERLETIRRRLETWIENPISPAQRYWGQAWLEMLNRPLDQLLAFMVSPSERANQLRQSTPFAGLLTPTERWAIHRSVRQHWLEQSHDESAT